MMPQSKNNPRAEYRLREIEQKHAMTPETEMDYFFARNCFTEVERKRVKAWPPYQTAMEKNDIIEAQEIAMRVLEKGLGLSPDSFAPRRSPHVS